jgi:hypothetical protein
MFKGGSQAIVSKSLRRMLSTCALMNVVHFCSSNWQVVTDQELGEGEFHGTVVANQIATRILIIKGDAGVNERPKLTGEIVWTMASEF